jgi:hypothetical protein
VRDCRESFRCLGCLHLGHRERDYRRRLAKPDAPSCDLCSLPLGSPHARSWAEVVVSPPVGGDPPASLRHPEVHGVFRRVEECHESADAS